MSEPYWEPLGAAPNPAAFSGQELAYAQRTAAFTGHAGSETDILITAPSITLDGLTKICVESFVPGGADTGGNGWYQSLFDNGVNIGRIVQGMRSGPLYSRYFLTPVAGAHIYAVSLWTGFGDYAAYLGAGGANTAVPAFLRVTRV